MKIYCISDSLETAIGMKLAGVESVVLNSKDEIEKKIDEVSNNQDIGILVISKEIYQMSKEKLDNIIEFKRTPLVIQI